MLGGGGGGEYRPGCLSNEIIKKYVIEALVTFVTYAQLITPPYLFLPLCSVNVATTYLLSLAYPIPASESVLFQH